MRIGNVHKLTLIADNLMKIMAIVQHAIKDFKFKTINVSLPRKMKGIPTVTSLKMANVSNAHLGSILMKLIYA